MASKTPQIMKTVIHKEVKTRFRSKEGGIMTFRPSFSCLRIWKPKIGSSTTAIENNASDAGSRNFDDPPARTENTYENMPREVLSKVQPIQSISVLMRWS